MASKSDKYHLEIQKHRKNPYGLLRNSYRENGKTKHDTLCRISGLSLEQLLAIQAAIQGKTVMKDDFRIMKSREWGASKACVSFMRDLGLSSALYSRQSELWVRCAEAIIVGRLIYQGSKLSLSHCGGYSALWQVVGIDAPDVNIHCYEAMDALFARQDAIQKTLAKRHLSDGVLILYDITSSYMEPFCGNAYLVHPVQP